MNQGQAARAKEMAEELYAQMQATISPHYYPSLEVRTMVELLCRAIVDATVPPYVYTDELAEPGDRPMRTLTDMEMDRLRRYAIPQGHRGPLLPSHPATDALVELGYVVMTSMRKDHVRKWNVRCFDITPLGKEALRLQELVRTGDRTGTER